MYSTALPRGYPACSGCSLCRLVCPMWLAQRDPRFSPEGIARACQCGATAADLAPVLEACSLCGACDPVCPERIDLSGMVMDLRLALPRPPEAVARQAQLAQAAARAEAAPAGALLLPGVDLRADPVLLARAEALLGFASAADDGADIALALATCGQPDGVRKRRFLDGLDGRTLVVGDGMLLAALRRWLPGARLQGLGQALVSQPGIRRRLTSADFYVIEARAYHADYERLVTYYDRLRAETGCTLNLDLQRIAIPAVNAAAVRWMLQGRRPARIVVESLADRAVIAALTELPVVHLAELAEEEP